MRLPPPRAMCLLARVAFFADGDLDESLDCLESPPLSDDSEPSLATRAGSPESSQSDCSTRLRLKARMSSLRRVWWRISPLLHTRCLGALAQRWRFASRRATSGLRAGSSSAIATKSGLASMSRKPICPAGTSPHSLSISGDMGRPSSRSISPCAKNSACTRSAHSRCWSQTLTEFEMSAALMSIMSMSRRSLAMLMVMPSACCRLAVKRAKRSK
mmetsp:Transcript_5501/g.21698  ORF Transcript_5501/g.21698 Transcript_5501/m.21698 type:complete len:215 (-) Transcript_5501:2223-2867(-)